MNDNNDCTCMSLAAALCSRRESQGRWWGGRRPGSNSPASNRWVKSPATIVAKAEVTLDGECMAWRESTSSSHPLPSPILFRLPTHTRVHAYTHTNTHSCMRMHTQTHTHTHTHTPCHAPQKHKYMQLPSSLHHFCHPPILSPPHIPSYFLFHDCCFLFITLYNG